MQTGYVNRKGKSKKWLQITEKQLKWEQGSRLKKQKVTQTFRKSEVSHS